MNQANAFHLRDVEAFQMADGTVRLSQAGGIDEPVFIELHPSQLVFITSRVCGVDPAAADRARDLERKLAVLESEIASIVFDKIFRNDLIEGDRGNCFEYLARLDALHNLAVEYVFGLVPPSKEDEDSEKAAAAPESSPPIPQRLQPRQPPQHVREQLDLIP